MAADAAKEHERPAAEIAAKAAKLASPSQDESKVAKPASPSQDKSEVASLRKRLAGERLGVIWEERRRAAEALGQVSAQGDAEVVVALRESLLRDGEGYVRAAAAKALAQVSAKGDAEVIALLRAKLSESSATVREAAAQALKQMEADKEEVDAAEAEIFVDLLDGEVIPYTLPSEATVRDLKRCLEATAQQRDKPMGTTAKVMLGGRELQSAEKVGPLAGSHVQGVWLKGDNSYLILRDGRSYLVTESDVLWDEQTANQTQFPESRWVPKPENAAAAVKNFAKVSEGARVTVSSSAYSHDSVQGQERLLNLIRLGSKFGDPVFWPDMYPDHSFQCDHGDRDETMILHLGRRVLLLRVGTIGYVSHFIGRISVETSEDAEGDAWVLWGESLKNRIQGGPAYFDREPTAARRVRMRLDTGNYSPSRFGPVFAWGLDEACGKDEDDWIASI